MNSLGASASGTSTHGTGDRGTLGHTHFLGLGGWVLAPRAYTADRHPPLAVLRCSADPSDEPSGGWLVGPAAPCPQRWIPGIWVSKSQRQHTGGVLPLTEDAQQEVFQAMNPPGCGGAKFLVHRVEPQGFAAAIHGAPRPELQYLFSVFTSLVTK